MEFKWSRFADLSPFEVHTLLQAREAVFVVEQNCPYLDADDLDVSSWHLFVRVGGLLAATCRVVEPGLKFSEPSIGRVLSVQAFRKQGLGRALMREAIRFTEERYPHQGIQIGAQAYLLAFYASFGFEPIGEEYDEDGIPHWHMIKRPI